MKEQEALKKLISQNLQQQLDLKLTEIEEDLPFIQLGLDSEGVVELITYLNGTLGLRCSASVIFDHPSLNRLAEFLWKLQCDAEPPETRAGSDPVSAPSDKGEAQGLATPAEKRTDRAVAIIGISGRYPGAAD